MFQIFFKKNHIIPFFYPKVEYKVSNCKLDFKILQIYYNTIRRK